MTREGPLFQSIGTTVLIGRGYRNPHVLQAKSMDVARIVTQYLNSRPEHGAEVKRILDSVGQDHEVLKGGTHAHYV